MRFFSASYAVLALMLLLSAATFWVVRATTDSRNGFRFENAVQGAEDRIKARLETYGAVLRGSAAFFAASERVTPEEFATYTRRLQLKHRYPGIQGIGYSERIMPGREDSVLAMQHQRSQTPFTFWPNDSLAERHAILYLEPQDERNKRAMGYNMYSEATRRAAMQRARDEGQASLSGKVELVQEIDEDKQAGFLMYVPLYHGGGIPLTVAERRAALQGFVYAPFRADDLLSGIFSAREAPRAAFRIYDGPQAVERALLHDSRRAGVTPVDFPRYNVQRQISVAGRTWTITYAETPSFASGIIQGTEWYVALLCVGLSILVFLLTREQERRADEARQTERRLRALLEGMPVGVLVADDTGKIAFANTAARRLWEVEDAESDVLHTATSWTAPLDAAVPDPLGLERALRGRSIHSEVLVLRTGDGERTLLRAAFPLDLQRGGTPQAVAVVADISAQKAAQEAEARAIREQAGREAAEMREHELRRAATALQRSNRELQDFTYIASHDLQEPLRRISAFIDLVRLDYADNLDATGQHYLDRIQHGALRLSQLIRDLLAFSRLATRPPAITSVALAPLITRIVDAAEAPGVSGGLTLDALPTVQADAAQMRQLFEHLIANAVKFRREGVPAEVTVTATEVDNAAGEPGWRIAVRDNGMGFDARYAGRIFTPFQRLHPKGTHEGTGIGLAICRRIAENHHGTLTVESIPGEGSTFYLWLPLHPVAEPYLIALPDSPALN